MIFFSGVERSGKSIFIPIISEKTIEKMMYKCSKKFDVEYLQQKSKISSVNLHIGIDGSNSTIVAQEQDSFSTLAAKKAYVKNKQKKGGYSQQRYERNRRHQRHNYLKSISEYLKEEIIENKTIKTDAIFLYGTGQTKDELFELLNIKIKEKIKINKKINFSPKQDNFLRYLKAEYQLLLK